MIPSRGTCWKAPEACNSPSSASSPGLSGGSRAETTITGNARPAARQLVSHRGITVNGKSVNLPSYAVKAGDAIALSEKAAKQLRVKESLTVAQQMDLSPSWVEVDASKFAGVFKAVPDRADLPRDINEALIVELYSK